MSGFTLLELLIALAAGALLIAAVSDLLISIKDGWTRAARIEQQWREETSSQQLISRVLEAAIPPEHPNFQGVHFKGMENSIEFSTVPSQSAFASGRVEGRLFLAPNSNGLFTLELRLGAPVFNQPAKKPSGQNWTLLKDIETVEFFYFSKGSRQGSKLWVNMDKLPELIKLHVIFADKARLPFWIIAHPYQTVSGNCLLDQTSFVCRAS
ncbi:prepilin-type N-terminal cleavage/methylation domain-containing protein [Methylomonas sp. UP202]|uniref:prepilin-type N-terminal cleavage/methylation domain-containing protein n=1 Tax=Methylomonas sp. UP202 TaxID=3040943 RepID=UPI00247AC3FA|nr:prepilin-type N-terminal cleavage/methylation domain-containing protein [Methylomonas sp. UP202]WGS88633.1 prepilin-type N-terminal cleavage/methylation domain-containing protein [Methylomonas sp. UP202]